MSSGFVASEIHQDSLFLDGLGEHIFDEEAAEEGDTDDPDRVTSTFIAEDDGEKLMEIQLAHYRLTSVSMVGLQVWRGSLLLSDFILNSKESDPSPFRDKVILELAAGTGLTSVVAATVAKSVICTDIDLGDILPLIRTNLEANSRLYPSESEAPSAGDINFFKSDWKSKLEREISRAEVLLVADVCYSQEITTHFFKCLEYILKLKTVQDQPFQVFLAIEKRLRVDESGESVAPNFQHFVELLEELKHHLLDDGWIVKRLETNFKQFFKCYERVEELHLWKISNR